MIEYYEISQIEEVIKKGFDLKLISTELSIPMQELIKLKQEMQNRDRLKILQGNIKKNYLKVEKIRRKYNELLYENKEAKNKKKQEDTALSTEQVKNIILDIKNAKMDIDIISKNINELNKCNLSIEQCKNMLEILDFIKQNKKLKMGEGKKLQSCKEIITIKWLQGISKVIQSSNDIEELNEIKKQMDLLANSNSMYVKTLKEKISYKIFFIKQQNKKNNNNKTNAESENIEKLTFELLNEEIDTENAKKIVEEENKIRIENSSKNNSNFAQTDKKSQIAYEIQRKIENEPDKYIIKNPQLTIQKMQDILEINLESILKTVIENLIQRKEYNKAKEVCERYSKINNDIEDCIVYLRKSIKNAETRDMILNLINNSGTIEEQSNALEEVEEKIRLEHINTKAVVLGKSLDGIKTIRLYDVWEDNERDFSR